MRCRRPLTICTLLLATLAQAQVSRPGVPAGPPDAVQKLFGASPAQRDLLPADQAFKLTLRARDAHTVVATLTPAKGYYLYRDRIRFDVVAPSSVGIAKLSLPVGQDEDDPTFGTVQVYHQAVEVLIALRNADAGVARIKLHAAYQGCNEPLGVCYPPIDKTLALDLRAPIGGK